MASVEEAFEALKNDLRVNVEAGYKRVAEMAAKTERMQIANELLDLAIAEMTKLKQMEVDSMEATLIVVRAEAMSLAARTVRGEE